MNRASIVGGVCAFALAQAASAQLVLGSFVFNQRQFGNTLYESDGGSFARWSWLSVTSVNPGNPGALTGPSFDTGISNLGSEGSQPLYTIGYDTPIINGPGADLGVVTARFSTDDTISLAVSVDGSSFTAPQSFAPGLGVPTFESRTYYWGSGPYRGPYTAWLFVTPVDLDLFGVGPGGGITGVRVTGSPELDLIRVAGFEVVPEPQTCVLVTGLGMLGLGIWRRRRKNRTGCSVIAG